MKTAPLSLLILTAFVMTSHAELSVETVLYEAAEADAQIRSFMNERWHRQLWVIEYRPIEGLTDRTAWHVKGTMWWVRIEGPGAKGVELSSLDKNIDYEFIGLPVDQNYGVITFYLTKPPQERLVRSDPNNP
jgi:hypothetical protein